MSNARSRGDQFVIDMLKGLVTYEFNQVVCAPDSERVTRFEEFAERIAGLIQRAAKGAELASASHATDAELAHELERRGWMLNWDSGFLLGIRVPQGASIQSTHVEWNPNTQEPEEP